MYITQPLLAWALAQILKLIVEGWKDKKIDFRRIIGSGGMPSSHAAVTVALTTNLWKSLGIGDPIVAVSLIFTLIVIYDAAGIRQAAGKQAALLNMIIEELNKPITDHRLKELLGHTPTQVLAGSLLGFLLGFYA
ncbi:MAG: divergent PAP2 family protein [Dethiobacteria bacterium]|jgi:acid phosphatase family membrane protein YuiD